MAERRNGIPFVSAPFNDRGIFGVALGWEKLLFRLRSTTIFPG
jgi:hypothetical protein